MTTPARNVSEEVNASQDLWSYPSWYPPALSHNTYLVLDHGRLDKRPSSVKNPIRPNGTRAPSAFNQRWLVHTFSAREFATAPKPGRGAWIFYGRGAICSQRNAELWGSALSWNDSPTGHFPTNVENQARANFFKKLASGKAQLGSALGEARETAEGIHRAASEVASALQGISSMAGCSRRAAANYLRGAAKTIRGQRRTASGRLRRDYLTEKGLEEVRQRWLQSQFELKPLIHDIQDAGQALSDSLFERGLDGLFKVRAGATDTDTGTFQIWSASNGGMDYHTVPFERTTSMHISAVYRIPDNAIRSINQLGLGNPASVIWEVTRFSWLVDYVLGVGDWLNSMFVDDDGTSFVEGSISRIQRAARNGDVVFKPHPDLVFTQQPSQANLVFSCGRFEREVLDGRLVPPILPAVRVHMGLNQMANTLAVLSQIVGK